MILANKVMILCFGLSLTTIYSTLTPAAAREDVQREGESPEDFARRRGDIEGKIRAQEIKNEPLSLIEDYPYIKYYGGYRRFYESPKSHFLGLSKGKMKTFFEEWIQEAIKSNNIEDIREAYRAAVSFTIPINQPILAHATKTVEDLLNIGMLFLTQTLPPKEVHKIGHSLKQLADSVR